MGNIMREEMMELDLNEEPFDSDGDSMMGLGSLLNDLDTAHGRIEERIRQLEAVTYRAMQRQSWRQDHGIQQTTNVSVPPASGNAEEVGVPGVEMSAENDKLKKGGTDLIAKALEMASIEELQSKSGSFYDCNMCLEMARDPILTCCGHLFCWSCFYQLPNVRSNAKECPECKGEVVDSDIIPIYGNGSSKDKRKLNDSGQKVPPRPNAQRIESSRQQLINEGASSATMAERIQQFRNMAGGLRGQTQPQYLNRVHNMSERTNFLANRLRSLRALPGAERRDNHLQGPLPLPSSLLLQGAASFSSLSSALDSAERLVQDLEVYIHSRRMSRSHQHSPNVSVVDPFPSVPAVIQPQSQTLDTAAYINYMTPTFSSPSFVGRNGMFPAADNNVDISSTLPPSSSSSRRRSNVQRSLNVDDAVFREHRRRRLR